MASIRVLASVPIAVGILLIEAGVVRDRTVTSWPSLSTDLETGVLIAPTRKSSSTAAS